MAATRPFPRGRTTVAGGFGERRRRTRTIAFPWAIVAAAVFISLPGRLPAAIGVRGTIESRRTVGLRPAGESSGAIRSRTAARSWRTIRTVRAGRMVELRRTVRGDGRCCSVRWRRPIAPQVLRKTPPLLVAGDLEAIARILVLAARTPGARTSLTGGRAVRATLREGVGAFLVLRCP